MLLLCVMEGAAGEAREECMLAEICEEKAGSMIEEMRAEDSVAIEMAAERALVMREQMRAGT